MRLTPQINLKYNIRDYSLLETITAEAAEQNEPNKNIASTATIVIVKTTKHITKTISAASAAE